jgi:uncharacterized membrane protein
MTAEIQIENYLTALRLHLGPLTIAEREEIVQEINAHIRDSAEQSGASVETILARLGSAEELAAQYRDGLLIRRASRSNSPLLLMRGALRLATKGVFGIVVISMAVFGYAMGGGLVLSGLTKPILPANTGVWLNGDRFISSGTLFPAPAPPAHEVMGMWYVPLALSVGSLLLLLTNYLIRKSLRLSQSWQSKL